MKDPLVADRREDSERVYGRFLWKGWPGGYGLHDR